MNKLIVEKRKQTIANTGKQDGVTQHTDNTHLVEKSPVPTNPINGESVLLLATTAEREEEFTASNEERRPELPPAPKPDPVDFTLLDKTFLSQVTADLKEIVALCHKSRAENTG